jgi:hypothetical protein
MYQPNLRLLDEQHRRCLVSDLIFWLVVLVIPSPPPVRCGHRQFTLSPPLGSELAIGGQRQGWLVPGRKPPMRTRDGFSSRGREGGEKE